MKKILFLSFAVLWAFPASAQAPAPQLTPEQQAFADAARWFNHMQDDMAQFQAALQKLQPLVFPQPAPAQPAAKPEPQSSPMPSRVQPTLKK